LLSSRSRLASLASSFDVVEEDEVKEKQAANEVSIELQARWCWMNDFLVIHLVWFSGRTSPVKGKLSFILCTWYVARA
jgi:hypothetical protein